MWLRLINNGRYNADLKHNTGQKLQCFPFKYSNEALASPLLQPLLCNTMNAFE